MAAVGELQRLLAASARENSRRLLHAELERRTAARAHLHPPMPPQPPKPPALGVEKAPPRTVFTSVTSYAWDQTQKWVKVYLTLPGLEDVADEAITFHSEVTSISVEVTGLKPPACNSRLLVSPLFGKIVVEQCSCTRKPGSMLLLKLRKATDGEEWETLDDLARKKAREKEERLEENKNKSTSQLLQELYRDADEEGKASLSKAWEEGRAKREARRGA